jgi:hypothetical protein
MPKKERFQHAQFGRASSSVLLSKLPVLSWTAAEAANLLFISVSFFVFRTIPLCAKRQGDAS